MEFSKQKEQGDKSPRQNDTNNTREGSMSSNSSYLTAKYGLDNPGYDSENDSTYRKDLEEGKIGYSLKEQVDKSPQHSYTDVIDEGRSSSHSSYSIAESYRHPSETNTAEEQGDKSPQQNDTNNTREGSMSSNSSYFTANDGYDVIGSLVYPERQESAKLSGACRTGCLTKKRILIGVLALLIILGVVLTGTLIAEQQSGEKNIQRNQEKQVCSNMPSPVMNYNAGRKAGIQGRQFLICFTGNHLNASNQSKIVFILSDEGEFEFKIISKFLNSTNLYTEAKTMSRNLKEIVVTNTMAMAYSTVEQKAILIETTKDVSIIIIDDSLYSSDSTFILPVESLSNTYIISSATPSVNSQVRSSQFAIASPENKTLINIHFQFHPDLPIKIKAITYKSGQEMILVLNELQTFQISHTVDMSGTIVKSSSPVAVFAGSFCKNIGVNNGSDSGYCSKLDEQLPPIDRLDKTYVVPPNYNRMGTVLKIVSPDENRITYKIGDKEAIKTLNSSEYFEITFSNDEIVAIDSENPVLVTSFSFGSEVTGDPYMIIIPGIRQYVDKFIVAVPGNFEKNYIALMVEETNLYKLVLNTTEIIHLLNDKKFYTTVTIRNIKFVVLVLQVHKGVLDIRSTNNAAFGLVVYGHRPFDGHGFAGKAVLPDECVQPSN